MASTKYTTQKQIEDMRREIQAEKEKRSAHSSPKIVAQKRMGRGKRKGITKSLGGALFGLLVVALLFSLISINLAKSRGEVPQFLGYYVFVIESGSMEPTLQVGTVILSRKPDHPNRLNPNDIVTFQTLSGALVTHRIIEVLEQGEGITYYRTKGDNPLNAVDQEVLTPDRVIGVFVARLF